MRLISDTDLTDDQGLTDGLIADNDATDNSLPASQPRSTQVASKSSRPSESSNLAEKAAPRTDNEPPQPNGYTIPMVKTLDEIERAGQEELASVVPPPKDRRAQSSRKTQHAVDAPHVRD